VSAYQDTIRECAARVGRTRIDPRHVEAWMLVEHPTLDGLSPRQFDAEVAAAIACIDEAGVEQSEALAGSFGL
jgi:hypothetical protein